MATTTCLGGRAPFTGIQPFLLAQGWDQGNRRGRVLCSSRCATGEPECPSKGSRYTCGAPRPAQAHGVSSGVAIGWLSSFVPFAIVICRGSGFKPIAIVVSWGSGLNRCHCHQQVDQVLRPLPLSSVGDQVSDVLSSSSARNQVLHPLPWASAGDQGLHHMP